MLKYAGAYSGAGVTSSKFDASVGGFGTHTLKYVFKDGNNCADSAISSIVVNAKPSVGLSPLGFACNSGASISILANGTVVGGTFIGTGVSGTNFDPTQAGTGTHNVSYFFTDGNNCADSTKGNVVVEASPIFSIVGDTIGCGITNAPVLKTTLPGMVYHWSNGSKVDTSIVTKSGSVWVKVTDPSNTKRCFSYDTVNGTYEEICVGLDERLSGTSVSYFPNPSNGTFNYDLKGFDGLTIDVTIITAGGQEVYRNV